MSNKLKLLHLFAITLALLFAVNYASTAEAQSGRRTPKPKPAALPTPEPSPTPASTSRASSRPTIKFILGVDDEFGSGSSVSVFATNGIRKSCAERLDGPDWIRVELIRHPMSRAEAVKLAKNEPESYVVHLRVRELINYGQTGSPNNTYIEYTVFAPGTAKLFTFGSAYPPSRNRNVILERRTSDAEGDYYLNKAAQDAADRILDKFGVHAPGRWPLAGQLISLPRLSRAHRLRRGISRLPRAA